MIFLLLEDYPFLHYEYLKYLENNGHKIIKFGEKYDSNEIDATISNIKVIDPSLLDNFPNLKYVCRVGVGLDMIDMSECKSRNIKVLNTPGANSSSVADIACWGIIGLLRKTYLDFENLSDGFKFYGRELSEVKVGILGFGNIGRQLFTRLNSFGVKGFEIYDPFCSKESIEKNFNCFKIENTTDIYKNNDVIIFTLPLFPETKHILGGNKYDLLKKDAIIVNVSRGGIVEEDGLIKFLKENPNSGAYLDVWEDEPNPPRKDLKELKNCIITPHIGAMTTKAYKNMHNFKELNN